jgi:hypothetical protein
VRKRDRIGKHVITGRVQDREVIAIIISDLLGSCNTGRGSITASERDYREAAQPCQQKIGGCFRVVDLLCEPRRKTVPPLERV